MRGLFSKKMSKPGGGFIASCEFQPSPFGVQINRPHFQILRAVGTFAGFLRSRIALCGLKIGRLSIRQMSLPDRNYEPKTRLAQLWSEGDILRCIWRVRIQGALVGSIKN
jgi:hypothetical protein